jgi:hypothetical protein
MRKVRFPKTGRKPAPEQSRFGNSPRSQDLAGHVYHTVLSSDTVNVKHRAASCWSNIIMR